MSSTSSGMGSRSPCMLLTSESQIPHHDGTDDLEYGSGGPGFEAAPPAAPPPRDFSVDWIRAGSIYAVVFVHTAVTVQWSVKHITPQELEKIQVLIRQFMQFGLGQFFCLSGAACGHSKDNLWTFLLKRTQRLLVPLLVAYLLVVVPDAYISRSWRYGADEQAIGFFRFYWSTVSTFRDGVGWLWFLPALWFLSLINYPVIAWFNNPRHAWATNARYLIITALVCLFGLGGGILACSIGPSWTRCLCAIPIWLPYVYTILIPVGRRLFTIACSLLLVWVMFATGVGERTDLWSNMTFSILFYNYWYFYGIIYTFGNNTQEQARYYPAFSRWIMNHRPYGYTNMPESFRRFIGTVKAFLIILLAAIGTPTHREDVGYYWRFPVYNTIGLVVWYVIGAWCWFLLVVYAATYTDGGLNTDFPSAMLCREESSRRGKVLSDALPLGAGRGSHPTYMRLRTQPEALKETSAPMLSLDQARAGPGRDEGSSWTERLAGHAQKVGMIVYLFHWLFADILTGLFVVPFDMSFSTALPFLYIGCILCSWCMYAVIIQVPLLRIIFAA
ncbi:hypothetical protein FOZ61_009777 [Perkinsus olseni]|uniref:Acyltransferase 3 domain-containing protein n=1 Tax=Perkinsus olseni TaxID=32597 RepID=A0A7J6MKY0_PEROL|nr:hypothetical protein FOZ61_009777 [Perkinsus olseni]KAF4672252.1 hypothetical protein FOL46_009245 [Perkinsus olseni]